MHFTTSRLDKHPELPDPEHLQRYNFSRRPTASRKSKKIAPHRLKHLTLQISPSSPAHQANFRKGLYMTPDTHVIHTPYQQSVAEYWNKENDPVNISLGEIDGLYHHHYGIGDINQYIFENSPEVIDSAIIREMHRLESNQSNFLLDHIGDIKAGDRLLDAGSGRGGTSFMAHDRFSCHVDGISISECQIDFSQEQAKQRGVQDKVKFHLRNMLTNGFEENTFHGIWNNESTMYVDLNLLLAEHARVMRKGGRYVCITGCYDDSEYGFPSRAVSIINAHYICNIHAHGEYLRALQENHFDVVLDLDLTKDTIPYWELRMKSSVATGIEDAFLTAYRSGGFQYRLISANRA